MVRCFTNEEFYWVERNEVWRCDLAGRAERFADIPLDLVEWTLAEHERKTGVAALQAWSVRIPQRETEQRATPRLAAIGDRPSIYHWWLTYDEKTRSFFLSNIGMPHVLLCLAEDGRPRWCRYLSPGCCGARGHRLSDGLLVASSGCGGILTWFDDEGNIHYRSKRHTGVGLASAYDDVTVLSSGVVLVSGGPGLLAYDRGELVWEVETHPSGFGVWEDAALLVLCDWKNSATPSVEVEARHLLDS